MAEHTGFIEEGEVEERPIIRMVRTYGETDRELRLKGGHVWAYEDGEFLGSVGYTRVFEYVGDVVEETKGDDRSFVEYLEDEHGATGWPLWEYNPEGGADVERLTADFTRLDKLADDPNVDLVYAEYGPDREGDDCLKVGLDDAR